MKALLLLALALSCAASAQDDAQLPIACSAIAHSIKSSPLDDPSVIERNT